ncbi:MAG: M1 family aminopeptidase [Candidatus Zixiibacteriota bacterium]
MRYYISITCLVFVIIGQYALATTPEWYAATYDSIRDLRDDHCLQIEVSDYIFEFDRARLILQTGDLYLLPSVAGESFECMFMGKAKITIEPPTEIEKFTVKKHLKTESIDLEFNQFRIMASPELISRSFDFSSAIESNLPRKLKSFLKTSNSILRNDKWNVWASVLGELKGDAGSFAWVHLNSEKGRRNIFVYSDLDTEPVRFYKRSRHKQGDYPELVFSCYPIEHYETGQSWKHRAVSRTIAPIRYTIEAAITEQAHLTCEAKLDFISDRDSLLSLYALIFGKTDMDSVLDARGDTLFISKLDDESGFSLFLSEPLSKGDTSSLTFYYTSEDMISKSPTGDFYIDDQVSWYPIIEYLLPSHYDVTFSCPKQLTLLSVGEKAVDSVAGEQSITRWVTTEPELFSSFNYGLFDTLTLQEPGAPEVKIYRGRTHTGDLFRSDMKESVGGDVLGALRLYTELYGEIRYDPILAAEIPYGRGQGMPGLLHLAWGTFQDDDPIWDASFRAHEVAHQWWGHTVRWESYHDQWMSEAFSEFSAALYVQQKLEDDKKYFEILDVWRRDALQKGKTFRGSWSAGTEAGPIWLGLRLSSSKSDDFMALSYSKGGYIMHMLRCLMKDWESMSDDRFFAMMRDFVETFRGKAATTEDFQMIVEKHIGEPMDWFFDQWIYGIEVPRLSFKEHIREESGRFLIDLVIEQHQISGSFKSVIPVRVGFGDGSWDIIRIAAVGELTTNVVGPFSLKPKDIEFNFYKSVLSR